MRDTGEIEGQLMLEEVAEMDAAAAEKHYQAFTGKFKPKKTTDDCYTPENVMEAVQTWVAAEYGLDRSQFLRPFWPGADYQAIEYPEGCVVVDNLPFSILAQICTWYAQRGIRFFLFGPALTICSARTVDVSYIITDNRITYENGAEVPTSFITNLDTCRLRTAPELCKAIEAANRENIKKGKQELPKYIYPDEIMTAAIAQRWCHYGLDYRLEKADCVRIGALDAQKAAGKAIFGSGFLLSERAALERAALERAALEQAALKRAEFERTELERAERWPLSERERAISWRLSHPGETKEERKLEGLSAEGRR